MREICILDSAGPASRGDELEAFLDGLMEEGLNDDDVFVSYCWANSDRNRLARLANQIIGRKVKVLVAAGGTISALAAKAETDRQNENIPIVFTAVTDPVGSGLVTSLDKPGGNVTGVAGITSELDPRRLEFLCEVVPKAEAIGVLVHEQRPAITSALKAAMDKAAGRKRLVVEKANTEAEISAAFQTFANESVGAVLVTSDPFFNSQRKQLTELAASKKLPAMYQWPEFVEEAGGLMSYGPKISLAYEQSGKYSARILNGISPADLPVIPLTSLELVVSTAAEKALGISVPSEILGQSVRRAP